MSDSLHEGREGEIISAYMECTTTNTAQVTKTILISMLGSSSLKECQADNLRPLALCKPSRASPLAF